MSTVTLAPPSKLWKRIIINTFKYFTHADSVKGEYQWKVNNNNNNKGKYKEES